MTHDEILEKLAEWLFRYRSFQQRVNAWTDLCKEDPRVADFFRRDARKLLDFLLSLEKK